MMTATVQVSEKPILFSGPMVRAILKGRKTQTRRVIKPQPERDPFPCHWVRSGWSLSDPWEHGVACTCREIKCPYMADRLWVRETFSPGCDERGKTLTTEPPLYRADDPNAGGPDREWQWVTAIYMPRWASRLTLEITDIRVERLMEITNEDIRAEGVTEGDGIWDGSLRAAWANGWNAINEKRGYSWLHNPWVWVIEFRRSQ